MDVAPAESNVPTERTIWFTTFPISKSDFAHITRGEFSAATKKVRSLTIGTVGPLSPNEALLRICIELGFGKPGPACDAKLFRLSEGKEWEGGGRSPPQVIPVPTLDEIDDGAFFAVRLLPKTPSVKCMSEIVKEHEERTATRERAYEDAKIVALHRFSSSRGTKTLEEHMLTARLEAEDMLNSHLSARSSSVSLPPIAGGGGPPRRRVLCSRCKREGHWASDCPTRGDKRHDRSAVHPYGIPKKNLKRIKPSTTEEGHAFTQDPRSFVQVGSEFAVWETAGVRAIQERMKGKRA